MGADRPVAYESSADSRRKPAKSLLILSEDGLLYSIRALRIINQTSIIGIEPEYSSATRSVVTATLQNSPQSGSSHGLTDKPAAQYLPVSKAPW
jgi:hypothetical protein